MRAALIENGRVVVRNDFPQPAPAGREALIRVRLAGVCSTDLQLLRGYKGGFQGVLGHEFVGEVVSCPADTAWEGRRVVGEINVGCGECNLCRRGLSKHCRRRSALGIAGRDGAFADYTLLPVENLHVVPDNLGDDAAVFTEPLAAAFELLDQVAITPESRVTVLGDGRLGLLCAFVLAQTRCDLTVVGRHPSKLALLAATKARLLPASAEVFAQLEQDPADVVVEATGSKAGFATALRLVRPLGTVMLKSTFAETIGDFDISHLVVDEVTVVGSRCGPFVPALHALASGRINPRPLIHAEFQLEDAARAVETAGQQGVLKVLIRP